jgi:hypothetical protein
MAGGGGVEWYFGYKFPNNDLNCEDFRSRDHLWDLTRIALEFFQNYLPYSEMSPNDALTSATDDYCLAKPGEYYAIYLPRSGTTGLDLGLSNGELEIKWYNPRTGGALQNGTVATIKGPGVKEIGLPPSDAGMDWVVLAAKKGIR